MALLKAASEFELPGHAATGNAATAADERRQRKRLQNRLNQRASRSRNHQKETTGTKAKHRQYQIDRWRLDEHGACPLDQTLSNSAKNNHTVQDQLLDPSSTATWFPLPSDHLLHLIKYNVFRGLWQNKVLLERLTVQYVTANKPTDVIFNKTSFPTHSVIMPLAPQHYGCLTPTPAQMNVVHSTWINVLPFPTMRENLIQWEFAFDHSELVRDLVGDLINLKIFTSASSSSTPVLPDKQVVVEGDEEETTATQTGLIIWGEPHRADGWEATPGFLHKWAWAVADCQELIDSTNYWRVGRGEKPLRLSGKVDRQ